MRVKIYNGTAVNGESSLCDTCRMSTIIRGRTLDEEIIRCQADPMQPIRVTFKVTSCTGYSDDRLPSYFELMEKAWILQPGSRKRPAAFVRGSDLRDEEYSNMLVTLRQRREP